jgi:hypothetical protein
VPSTYALASVFSPDEAELVGAYQIFVADGRYGTNQKSKDSPDADFLISIRMAMSESCRVSIQKEMASPSGSNLFLKSQNVTPTAAEISETMSRFFGSPAPVGGLHDGAAEYANLLKKNVDLAPAGSVPHFLQKNLEMLCVQLGMDPRFYTR